MKVLKNIAGPFIYAVAFLLVLPYFLIIWAEYTEGFITYPPVFSIKGGGILMGIGALLMLWAMVSLKRYGKGLPMNAYPPPVFVQQGPYRIFHHPIYIGFALLLTGYFIFKGSASGLWLVTPVTIMAMMALVWGYEVKDLKERFPDQQLHTLLDLPASSGYEVRIQDRIVTLLWIIPVLLLYNFLAMTLTEGAEAVWGSEWSWPLLSEAPLMPYLGVFYLFWVSAMAEHVGELRELKRSSLLALGLSLYGMLLFPQYGLQSTGMFETDELSMLGMLPVFMVFIGLWQIRKTGYIKVLITGVLGITVVMYQLTQTPSAPLHLGFSFVIFLLAVFYDKIWTILKEQAEWIANSWKEWYIGRVRVINHGFYVGFAAFFGILLAGMLAGPGYAWGLLVFSITVVVFSALWAQVIEGSEKLKRPYGYYGALVGIIFASGAVWAMGLNGWLIIGVVSVVMPWVQAIGRLRCLINGCCHGHKVDDPHIGIRYFHPRSRVCGISDLRGELLHPTQLYAILWLLFIGFVLLQLWLNGFSASFIFGLYLILTGLGRFVEEAYRGEVQTSIVLGLRLYQWTALLSVLVGIAMTFMSIQVTAPVPLLYPEAWFAALLGGLFVFAAMGVDFPESNARFSRLV